MMCNRRNRSLKRRPVKSVVDHRWKRQELLGSRSSSRVKCSLQIRRIHKINFLSRYQSAQWFSIAHSDAHRMPDRTSYNVLCLQYANDQCNPHFEWNTDVGYFYSRMLICNSEIHLQKFHVTSMSSFLLICGCSTFGWSTLKKWIWQLSSESIWAPFTHECSSKRLSLRDLF